MSRLKSEAKIYEIPIKLIKLTPFHPRKIIDEKKMNKLVKSITEVGVLQPLIVRKIDSKFFELIVGERRLRASLIAGFDSVPCIILNCDNVRSIIYSLVENEVQINLSVFEIAKMYKRLIIDYCLNVEDISNVTTINADLINRYLKLLKYTEYEQEFIDSNGISLCIAEQILSLEDIDLRLKVLNKVAKEKLTLAQTKLYIDVLLHPEETKNDENKQIKLHKFLVKDSRIFVNTLNNTIEKINLASIGAKCSCIDSEDFIEYSIKIPKTPVCDKIA